MAKKYFVYLVQCRNKSYYCGYTADLKKRIESHNAGKGGAYTRSHRPVKLVYFKTFQSRKAAMKRERQIKTYSRKQKQELIAKNGKSAGKQPF